MLVGDIDFDGDPGLAVSATDPVLGAGGPTVLPPVRRRRFPPLPGTLREVEAIQNRFTTNHTGGDARLLRGSGATEGAFRSSLVGSRFVHLATHGYFDPSPMADRAVGAEGDLWRSPQYLAMQNPTMLSGIAFAGANRPFRPDREDGILTALERKQLDLSGTDLVVLSACESSLGTRTQGEGLMGLDWRLQVAGARSLISSLWQVDDVATATLMEEFYTNLWERRLPRIEALRQAQITLLRRHDTRQQRLVRGGEIDRPETPVVAPRKGDVRPPAPMSPPRYWAAFTLSGEWR